MAGRNAAPKANAPDTTKRQARRSRLEPESNTPVDRSRMEADLGKLIDSLTEWTREMQAARPAVPEAPAPKRRAASRKEAAVTASRTPLYPRGNPLTLAMEFTDRAGTAWLAYVEGAEKVPTRRLRKPTTLPGRRLRFDSATESRFTTRVPAGCPWLPESRLRTLLDEAGPDQPPTEPTAAPVAGDWVVEWPLRAAKSGQEAVADGYRRWQKTAPQRKAMGRKVLDLASEAAESMHGITEVILGHRPARS